MPVALRYFLVSSFVASPTPMGRAAVNVLVRTVYWSQCVYGIVLVSLNQPNSGEVHVVHVHVDGTQTPHLIKTTTSTYTTIKKNGMMCLSDRDQSRAGCR